MPTPHEPGSDQPGLPASTRSLWIDALEWRAHAFAAAVTVLALAALSACETADRPAVPRSTSALVGPGAGSVTLVGIVSVSFPEGAFESSTLVTVETTSDPRLRAHYDEFADLLGVSLPVGHMLRIDVGSDLPTTEWIVLEFVAEDGWRESDEGTLIALVHMPHISDLGKIDLFEPVETDLDGDTRIISARVPRSAFTWTGSSHQVAVTLGGYSTADHAPAQGDAPWTSADPVCPGVTFSCPLAGGCAEDRVSSRFGPRTIGGRNSNHMGVDFRIPERTPVLAPFDGTIERVKVQAIDGFPTRQQATDSRSGAGLYVIVRADHPEGRTRGAAVMLAHLHPDTLLNEDLKQGQRVSRGQQIARSGNTGFSTGAHLHVAYVASGDLVGSPRRLDPLLCLSPDDPEVDHARQLLVHRNPVDAPFETYYRVHEEGRGTEPPLFSDSEPSGAWPSAASSWPVEARLELGSSEAARWNLSATMSTSVEPQQGGFVVTVSGSMHAARFEPLNTRRFRNVSVRSSPSMQYTVSLSSASSLQLDLSGDAGRFTEWLGGLGVDGASRVILGSSAPVDVWVHRVQVGQPSVLVDSFRLKFWDEGPVRRTVELSPGTYNITATAWVNASSQFNCEAGPAQSGCPELAKSSSYQYRLSAAVVQTETPDAPQ